MGLDVYVGPLCRWYSGDWKSIVQQAAEAQGIAFGAIYKNPPPSNRATSAEARDAILGWREALGLAAGGQVPPLNWDESPDADYLTLKPDWDGYWALRLLAAKAEFPEVTAPREVQLPSRMADPATEPLMKHWEKVYFRMQSRSGLQRLRRRPGPTTHRREFPHLQGPECWLPAMFDDPFAAKDVAGNRLVFGSVPRLLAELHTLNDRTIRATPNVIEQSLRDGPPDDDRRLEGVALYGLATFLECASYADQNQMPMRLDS